MKTTYYTHKKYTAVLIPVVIILLTELHLLHGHYYYL